MADLTWASVLLVAPELSTVASGAQTLILGLVNTVLSEGAFGDDGSAAYDLARAYLAAHFATVIGSGTSSGDVQSKSMGGLSITYATASAAGGGDIFTTNYGDQYMAIVNLAVEKGPSVC